MADGKVVFETELDTKGLESDLQKVSKSLGNGKIEIDAGALQKGVNQLDGVIGKLTGKGAVTAGITTAIVAGLAEAAKAGMEYNAQMEQYQANFSTLLGDEAEALQFVANMREMAAKTPFGMADLSKASQTLLSFGVSAEETASILTSLGDVSLGNSEKLSSLSLAFAQISAAGRLTAQDLLQLVGAGFNPLQTIAEQTGASLADLRDFMSGGGGSDDFKRKLKSAQNEVKKLGARASEGAKILAQMGSEGVISVDLVSKAIQKETSAGGRFYNGMEKASQTVQGLRSTFSDEMQELAGNLAQPLSDIQKVVLKIGVKTVETVNGLFDAFGGSASPAEGIRQTGEAARSTIDDLTEQAAVARVLTNQLVSLGEYSELTASGQMQWQAIASELVKVVPELSGFIDVQNGVFREGTSAIYEHIGALEQESKAQAILSAQSEILEESVNSQRNYYKASAAYDRANADWQAKQNTRLEMENRIIKEYGMSIDELIAKRSNALNIPYLTIGRSKKEIDADIKSYRDLVKEEKKASETAADLLKSKNELKEASIAAVTQADAEIKALQTYAQQLGLLDQIATSQVGSSTGGVFSTSVESTDSFRQSLEALLEEGEDVKAMFDEIAQYKADNLQKIADQVEGVYDAFDKADRVRSTSVKKMAQNIQSQIKQHEQYQQYMQQLKEMGASDALLGEFGFDANSIAQMQAILKSGPEGLAKIEAQYATLKTEQAETTALLNENAQALDTTLQSMEKAADNANKALTEKMNAIVGAAQKMDVEVQSESDTAKSAIDEVQNAGNELGLSEWEPKIEPEDNATSVINAISRALDRLDGKSIQVYIEAVESGFGGADGSHKTGLDYVPFDGYIAELHKGEAVLPADVARDYRQGIASAVTPAMLSGGMFSRQADLVSAMRNAMKDMNFEQTVNFNVPVQTPAEFAQTMELYHTYGLTEA